LGVGRKADDFALRKKYFVAKFKGMKTGSNVAESSKEGYGSKSGCFSSDDNFINDSHCVTSNESLVMKDRASKVIYKKTPFNFFLKEEK
jgi:hypothetical protein